MTHVDDTFLRFVGADPTTNKDRGFHQIAYQKTLEEEEVPDYSSEEEEEEEDDVVDTEEEPIVIGRRARRTRAFLILENGFPFATVYGRTPLAAAKKVLRQVTSADEDEEMLVELCDPHLRRVYRYLGHMETIPEEEHNYHTRRYGIKQRAVVRAYGKPERLIPL
jgi:hypothetical protein